MNISSVVYPKQNNSIILMIGRVYNSARIRQIVDTHRDRLDRLPPNPRPPPPQEL